MNRNPMAGAREQSRGDREIALGATAGGIEATRYERDPHWLKLRFKRTRGLLKCRSASCSETPHMLFLAGEVDER